MTHTRNIRPAGCGYFLSLNIYNTYDGSEYHIELVRLLTLCTAALARSQCQLWLFNKSAQFLLGKAGKIFCSSRLQSAQLSRESSESQVGVSFSFSVNRTCPAYNFFVLFFFKSAGRPVRSEHHRKAAGHCGAAEALLHPPVQAELSVFDDVLYRPEYLFQPGMDAVKSKKTTTVSSAGP